MSKINQVQINSLNNKGLYNNNKSKTNNNVSFGGFINPIIPVMDAVDRGGFAASFILQDFLGMAAPRVGTGMFRNSDKTGKINWDYAKKEGVRELLSGPSAFLIPAGMMYGIKKVSGTANNVPIDFINGFGEIFSKYAKDNVTTLADAPKTKLEFYQEVFKNMLSTSTHNKLNGKALEDKATEFANHLIEIEKAPKKGFFKNLKGTYVKGTAQDLTQELTEKFISIRKQYLDDGLGDKIIAKATNNGKKFGTTFKAFLGHMKDYSDDAIKTVNNKLAKTQNLDIEQFVKTLSKRRSGTRFLSNMGMLAGVAIFGTIIPKLYNAVTKGVDPGRAGLEQAPQETTEEQKQNNAEPTFTGSFSTVASKLGETVTKGKGLKKFSDAFEFSGASMSVPGMLTYLFGFCLAPRLKNAQSETDRKEIMFRDVLSFTSIIFGAKTLTRVFSDAFAQKSGLALNYKPKGYDKNIFKKVWSYVWPAGGVQSMDSDRLIANYSKVGDFQNGLPDMFNFVNTHGGNVGKMLTLDKDIKEAATEILGATPNKNMKLTEINKKFNKAKGTEAYEKIIKILEDKNNILVRKAKTYNSAFGFVSLMLLIPALMMWISKHCEKMTKERIAKEQEEAKANRIAQLIAQRAMTDQPTMSGFLGK